MGDLDILCTMEKNNKKPEELVEKVIKKPDLINTIIEGTTSKMGKVKFGSTKVLRLLSEREPKILYPHMDFFIELLDSDNNILKWNAQDIIANLTEVDTANKFDKIFKKYYDFISDDVMITAGHVVDNSGKIAITKRHFQDKITEYLFTVEKTPRNQECKNILLGKAILSFGKYFDQMDEKRQDKIVSFVKRQLNNSRVATKKKAEVFLKRVDPTRKKTRKKK